MVKNSECIYIEEVLKQRHQAAPPPPSPKKLFVVQRMDKGDSNDGQEE